MVTVYMQGKKAQQMPAPVLPCTLLSFLQQAGIYSAAPCGGNGLCGNCRIRALGDLSAPDTEEARLLGKALLADGIRLACRAKLIGEDAQLFLGGTDSIHTIDFANDRLQAKHPLGEGLGLAIDLGTTTIAGRLYDLKRGVLIASKTVQNPQAAFGADVVSRLTAARTRAQALSDAAKSSIQALTRQLMEAAKQDTLPNAAVLTANTAMLCLLFGYPVRTLSRAPFSLPHAFGETRPLSDLLPDATGTLLIPPCIGPFLGADIVTALLDTALLQASKPTALLDLGTNGEIALFDGTSLICCSTAAGPAFEGAGIRMGCSAIEGAIDRVVLQDGKFCCHTIGETAAVGICGSGLLDATACMLETGVLDASGLLRCGDRIQLGDTQVLLYQQDVRALQTAKAAIRAGLELLCKEAAIHDPELLLAGGFGNTLNLQSAARIGLIPREAVPRTHSAGNAALQGAAKLLMDSTLLEDCKEIAASAVILDLAKNTAFSEEYIRQMRF